MSTEPFFDTRIVDDDILVVLIRGSLDSTTTPDFDREIQKHLDEGRTKIIIDCRHLDYLSSMAIGRLIVLQNRLRSQGGEVKLATLLGPVAKVIDQVALGKVLDVYTDLEFARESFYEKEAPRRSLVKRLIWIIPVLLALWVGVVVVARLAWMPHLEMKLQSVDAQLDRLENVQRTGTEDSPAEDLVATPPASTLHARLSADKTAHSLYMNSVKILRVEDFAWVTARHEKIMDLLRRARELSLADANPRPGENGVTFDANMNKSSGNVQPWDGIAGPQLPPVAQDHTYHCAKDTQLVVSEPGLLEYDTSPNLRNASTVRSVDTQRTLGTVDYWHPDGSFAYTPPAGYTGADTFRYIATDGETNSIPATVTITLR